jgi:multidrug efflux pump subunit AcrB
VNPSRTFILRPVAATLLMTGILLTGGLGDIVGRLFREFSVTFSVTILVSAFVSLTLTPMMCSRLLKHKPEASQERFYLASENAFEAVIAFYGKTLKLVLRALRVLEKEAAVAEAAVQAAERSLTISLLPSTRLEPPAICR